MFVVVSYDVNTESKAGRRRLRRIAAACQNYGQRVQNSVFECKLDPAQWTLLKDRLLSEIDPKRDSLRFYYLGRNWQKRVERAGRETALPFDDPLIL